MAQDLIFTSNQSGGSSNSGQYVQDVFRDVVLPATNNTGLTDSASTNPVGALVGNADVPRYGVKTLWVKDIVLIDDRSKWVLGVPTYRIIWSENFPAVVGYVTATTAQIPIFTSNARKSVVFGYVGVVGKIRRAGFILQADTNGTDQLIYKDGTSTGNTTPGQSPSIGTTTADQTIYNFAPSETSNATNDLHDFRVQPSAPGQSVAGVVVYFENATTDVAVGPGTAYVNKVASTTNSETNLALPSFGSSMGGVGIINKTVGGAYAFSTVGASTITSIAQGSSGTNLLNVSLNTGASFPVGSGLVVDQGGGSYYIGGVQNVSTDTLTVYPTLPFGISNAVYRSWLSGASLAISATTMQLVESIDFSRFVGATLPIFDPKGNWAIYGINVGTTTVTRGATALQNNDVLGLGGASGLLRFQGFFSACELEIEKSSTSNYFAATFAVNGSPAFNIATNGYANGNPLTVSKQTILSEAGGGWNSFEMGIGASMPGIAISKINLYRHAPVGTTYGSIASIETFQAYAAPGAINATLMARGTARRVYADQLFMGSTSGLSSGWTRVIATSAVSGVQYIGSTISCVFTASYYGKNFAIVGTAPSGATVTVDGVGTTLQFNRMIPVASEGFHTLKFAFQSGTAIIEAFDFTASKGEIIFLGTSSAIASGSTSVAGASGVPGFYGMAWSGFHDNDTSWTTTSTAGFTLATGDASSTFTQRQSFNFPTVSSTTDGTGKTAGLSFTPTKTGIYFISALVNANNDTSNAFTYMQIKNGSTVVAQGGIRSAATGQYIVIPVQGIFVVASLAPVTLTCELMVSTGTAQIGPGVGSTGVNGTGNKTIEWSICYMGAAS